MLLYVTADTLMMNMFLGDRVCILLKTTQAHVSVLVKDIPKLQRERNRKLSNQITTPFPLPEGTTGQSQFQVPSTSPERNFAVVDNELALEALWDNIIVQEDKFRSGYECKVCDGEGFGPNAPLCKSCNGEKTVKDIEGNMIPCRTCMVGVNAISSGRLICNACKGKGGSILIPEESIRRPSSGTVLSVGIFVGRCECYRYFHKYGACSSCNDTGKRLDALQKGDRILYSNFTGHAIDFRGKGVLRIMHENEILTKLYGVGSVGKKIR